ncbi:MAG: hypothetical protein HN348_17030 [Proteobacteria bacterium]|jgi:hypothetical protein|nr:hypothetical protein [Pseudomonadota bacterium]
MADSKTASRQVGRMTVAFAGFAVICGLILLVLGTGPTSAQKRQNKVLAETKSSVQAAKDMDEALEDRNYGDVRKLNEELRDRLAIIEHEQELKAQ